MSGRTQGRTQTDARAEVRREVRELLAEAREHGVPRSDPRYIELCDARDRVDTKLLKVLRWQDGLGIARHELGRARASLESALDRLRQRLEESPG